MAIESPRSRSYSSSLASFFRCSRLSVIREKSLLLLSRSLSVDGRREVDVRSENCSGGIGPARGQDAPWTAAPGVVRSKAARNCEDDVKWTIFLKSHSRAAAPRRVEPAWHGHAQCSCGELPASAKWFFKSTLIRSQIAGPNDPLGSTSDAASKAWA